MARFMVFGRLVKAGGTCDDAGNVTAWTPDAESDHVIALPQGFAGGYLNLQAEYGVGKIYVRVAYKKDDGSYTPANGGAAVVINTAGSGDTFQDTVNLPANTRAVSLYRLNGPGDEGAGVGYVVDGNA